MIFFSSTKFCCSKRLNNFSNFVINQKDLDSLIAGVSSNYNDVATKSRDMLAYVIVNSRQICISLNLLHALFGNLQKVTAEQLNISPVLMASANSAGGVMGKMIDAQSIVVSSAATHQEGNEAAIFKAVFKHSIVLACLVALLVMFYAYVTPQVIP